MSGATCIFDFSRHQEMSQLGHSSKHLKMRGRGSRTYTSRHQPFTHHKYGTPAKDKTPEKESTDSGPIVAPRITTPGEKKEAGRSSYSREDSSSYSRGYHFSVRQAIVNHSFPRGTSISSAILNNEKNRLTVAKVGQNIMFFTAILLTLSCSEGSNITTLRPALHLNLSETQFHSNDLLSPTEEKPPFQWPAAKTPDRQTGNFPTSVRLESPEVMQAAREFPEVRMQAVDHDQMVVTQSILPETVFRYKTLLYDFSSFVPLETEILKGLDNLSQFYGQKVRTTVKSDMTAQQCHASCFADEGEVITDRALADASLKTHTRFWLKPGRQATEMTKHCPGVMAGTSARYMLELKARDKTEPCTLYHLTNEPASHFFPSCAMEQVHLNNVTDLHLNLTHRRQCSLECLTNESCNAFEWQPTEQLCSLGTDYFNVRPNSDSDKPSTVFTHYCDHCREGGDLAYMEDGLIMTVKDSCVAAEKDAHKATCICQNTQPDKEATISTALVNDIRTQLETNDIYGPADLRVPSSDRIVPVYEETRRPLERGLFFSWTE